MSQYLQASEIATYAPGLDLTSLGGVNSPQVATMLVDASSKVDELCHVDGHDFQVVTNERGRAAISSLGELFINVRRRPIYLWNGPTASGSAGIQAIRLVKGMFSVSLQLTNNGQPNSQPLYQISDRGNSVHYPSAYLAAAGTLMLGGSSQLMSLKGADVFYEIDYTAGYQTIPTTLKRATALVLRDMVIEQYNQMGAESFSQGSMSVHWGPTGESTFISKAERMLLQGNFVRMSLFG